MTVSDERRAEIEAEERLRREVRQRAADERWQGIGSGVAVVLFAIVVYAAGKWAGLL